VLPVAAGKKTRDVAAVIFKIIFLYHDASCDTMQQLIKTN